MRRILAALWLLLLALVGPVDAQLYPNGYYALYMSTPNVSITGAGALTETSMASVRIPANTIGPDGTVRIYTLWSMNNNANNKTVNTRYGLVPGAINGTQGGQFQQQLFPNVASVQGLIIVRNTGATNSQQILNSMTGPYNTSTVINTQTVDTTQDTYFSINGTLANAGDTLTLNKYIVEVYHQ